MTENTPEALRADYLARLDEAMRDLPHGVAADIRGGITEELEGLGAEATAQRIAQLGDPEEIAREAQREVPEGPTVIVTAPSAAPATRRGPATAVPDDSPTTIFDDTSEPTPDPVLDQGPDRMPARAGARAGSGDATPPVRGRADWSPTHRCGRGS